MLFQKKIIIGSIMSFIATAVGIVAVFFPDLFNLQKKKIETLDLVIEKAEQFDVLSKFISEREKDKKIFQLNLEICENIYNEDDFELIEKNKGLAFAFMSEYFNNKPVLTKFDIQFINEEMGDMDKTEIGHTCQGGFCPAVSYIFPTIDSLPLNADSRCSHRDIIGVQIVNGYFVHENTEYTRGAHEYHSFKLIPKESVLLKDY